MKQIALVLILCLALSSAGLAEASSADRFLSNLSDTWDSFLDMAEDAGDSVTQWADESGVTEWAENAASDLADWARENGLTDWAEGALKDLSAWFDEAGIADWATATSERLRAFAEENRPAVEAWLAQAGAEVREAWDTLMDADAHTDAEIQSACETVSESLGQMAGD